MQGPALLDFLVGLAEECEIRVRVLAPARSGGVEGEPPPRSGSCRVRGVPWLLLAPREPVEDRIEAVVSALRRFAGDRLESRWLPPAVRQRLDAPSPAAR